MRIPLLPSALLLSAAGAAAQDELTFSVDWHGPLQGTLDTGSATPITAADVLRPATVLPTFGPLPVPVIVFDGTALGLAGHAACVGSGPGDPCIEVDALSYGVDSPFTADPLTSPALLFSVDEYVSGVPLPAPSVSSEAPVGDVSADIVRTLSLPALPAPPTAVPSHVGWIDGDGLVSGAGALYPGWGGTEPNVPGTGLPGQPSDPGDNLDAFDVGPVPDLESGQLWFSLDAAFLDSAAGVSNSGSAAAEGFSGADVLRRLPGGAVVVYAPAASLGLDQLGVDTDDVDALILAENGVDGFQPSLTPFDWQGGATDMLAFSVRRGSAILGQPDSIQGLPIVPGDVLVPPVAGGNGNPGILIAAEAAGLSTDRSGGAGDDLNGGDTGPSAFLDCNDNGVEDAIDIGNGSSNDDNMNGVPDECEDAGAPFCSCDSSQAPCGNPDADAGCASSLGQGAAVSGRGTSSVATDDLVLGADPLPPDVFGLWFMGSSTTQAPLGAGVRCAGGSLYRYPVFSSGGTGQAHLGPGIAEQSCTRFGPGGCIQPGDTWHFQVWYRDPQGPCGTSNLSNAWKVTFTP